MTTAHAPVTEFFPTPNAVIRQLVAPVADRLRHSTILEPSAGKGDILDHLVEYHQVSKDNAYAIEINPELQREYKSYGAPEPARTIEDAIQDHIRGRTDTEWYEKFESEFFVIKVHKKGTVHLVFRDENLWERFNQEAARGKNWVGPGF